MTGILGMMLAGGAESGASLPASLFVSDSEISPTDAVATLTFRNDGTYTSVGSASAPSGTWRDTGASADYDIYFETTDSPTGSLTNTWLNLGTTRAWTVTDTTQVGGPVTASGTIKIRKAATGTILDTCPTTIEASKESA